MLNNDGNHICPLCEEGLIIGKDGEQYIKYDPEYRAKFEAGEITLDELSKHIKVYYDRTLLCKNAGNENTLQFTENEKDKFVLNPPCANFYGVRGGSIENPDVIVETVTIEDN